LLKSFLIAVFILLTLGSARAEFITPDQAVEYTQFLCKNAYARQCWVQWRHCLKTRLNAKQCQDFFNRPRTSASEPPAAIAQRIGTVMRAAASCAYIDEMVRLQGAYRGWLIQLRADDHRPVAESFSAAFDKKFDGAKECIGKEEFSKWVTLLAQTLARD